VSPGGPPDPSDPDRPPSGRRELGEHGEQVAAAWYEAAGYEVIERNWRRREGEVDLIVRRGRTVVFCEVKTRTSDRFGTGAEAVLPAKQRRIRRLASRWLSELTPASGRSLVDVRFDVVSITAGRVEVLEGAF
jgi:putative endonuclease